MTLCLLLAVAAGWPDPVANDVMPYHTSGLRSGPLVGRPEADSMTVWVRTETPQDFRVVFAEHPPLTVESPGVSGRTTAARDNTGTVTLTGLRPKTEYLYGVVTETGLIDIRIDPDDHWPSFRTLPDATAEKTPENPNGQFDFRFSIGCCVRQKNTADPELTHMRADLPAFRTLLRDFGPSSREPVAFHVLNGDFLYEEGQDGTRAGLVGNWQLYFDRGRQMRRALRSVPLVATFNDHEAGSNLDGAGEPGLGEGDYLTRDPALDVWRSFAGWTNRPGPRTGPIVLGDGSLRQGVLTDPDVDLAALNPDRLTTVHIHPYYPGRDPRKRGLKSTGVYATDGVADTGGLRLAPAPAGDGPVDYSIGTHHDFEQRVGNVHLFYLDTRSQRSEWRGIRHARDEDRFILSDTQEQWLTDGVHATDADFVIVVSPDPWTIYHSAYHVRPERGTASKGDGFCGYLAQRERLLESFDSLKKPVLIFTGDVHASVAAKITDNVWEFMVGPMNSAGHPLGTLGLPPLGGWFDSEGRTTQIRWLSAFPDDVPYPRLRKTYFAVVQFNNVAKAPLPQGAGLRSIPLDAPTCTVRFHDGATGRLEYAESVSTLDARPPKPPAEKKSRWPQ